MVIEGLVSQVNLLCNECFVYRKLLFVFTGRTCLISYDRFARRPLAECTRCSTRRRTPMRRRCLGARQSSLAGTKGKFGTTKKIILGRVALILGIAASAVAGIVLLAAGKEE